MSDPTRLHLVLGRSSEYEATACRRTIRRGTSHDGVWCSPCLTEVVYRFGELMVSRHFPMVEPVGALDFVEMDSSRCRVCRAGETRPHRLVIGT